MDWAGRGLEVAPQKRQDDSVSWALPQVWQ